MQTLEKLVNYNSVEGRIFKELCQSHAINPYITLIVESFIYKEIIKYSEDGNIVEKYMLKYGKLEGLQQEWYKNGQKYIECSYKKNKREGLYQEWYEDGQKSEECYYKEGKKEGICKRWYDNGQKWSECTYIDEKLEGLYQMWYDNGQKWSECTYKDGKLDGLFQSWSKNGQKWYKCIYKENNVWSKVITSPKKNDCSTCTIL